MRKFFSTLFLLTILSPLFSIGAGIEITSLPSTALGIPESKFRINENEVRGTVSFERIPFILGFGIHTHFEKEIEFIGFSGKTDLQFINIPLKHNFSLIGGIGATGKLSFNLEEDFSTYNYGPRTYFGFNVFLLDGYLELYGQNGIALLFEGNLNPYNYTETSLKFPLEAGIRFHF